mmetsp:Transcript_55253/g.103795  ORF Transcript_55253/g.103795 Transcript_55253/m.103795 type:complete len:270 (+) Transcript_55253:70-879(+)
MTSITGGIAGAIVGGALAGPVGAIVGGTVSYRVAAGVATTDDSCQQPDPQTAPHNQQMDLLRIGLVSQGQFKQLAQRLVPSQRPPPELIDDISEAVQRVLGESAQVEEQGSVKKHTNIIGSDFEYHITIPAGWFMGAPEVTLQQMCQVQAFLQSKGISAMMGPAALKVRYTEGRLEGSVDIVPQTGSYFDPNVVVEPGTDEFHNDIRRQNAARVLKYWVRIVQGHHVRSHNVEQLVLSTDSCSGCREDTHGLNLFRRACREGGYGIPCR